MVVLDLQESSADLGRSQFRTVHTVYSIVVPVQDRPLAIGWNRRLRNPGAAELDLFGNRVQQQVPPPMRLLLYLDST